MELSHLPIIDWDIALKQAGNKKDLAKEILDLLLKNLAEDISLIQSLYSENKHHDLLRRVHRLHGALCYCGLPRLKTIISQLEKDLNNNKQDRLSSLIQQLTIESNLLLKHSFPASH